MQETDYCKPVKLPYTRLRFYLETSQGTPEVFLIQLEYNLANASSYPNMWRPIARFDHNQHSQKGHDIRVEGLHMDLLDADNTKYDVLQGFESVPIEDAPEYCENYILEHADTLTADFEQRNNLDGKYYPP